MASRPVREPKRKLPHRLQSLFYSSNPPATKKLELVHSNPHIYIIDNFLSDGEIDYFDQIITDNESKFCKSYTEDGSRNRVISKERTSTFFHLTKCQDRIVRNVEQRAADIVGKGISTLTLSLWY